MELNTHIESVSTETEEHSTNESQNNQNCGTYLPSQTKRKKTSAVINPVADLKSIHKAINKTEPKEDSFDVFGKSVAMQLKKFRSLETCLIAQSKIQNILTEMGIENLRSQKRSSTPLSTLSYMDPPSVSSATDAYSYMSEGSGSSFTAVQNLNQNEDLLNRAILKTFSSTLNYDQVKNQNLKLKFLIVLFILSFYTRSYIIS